jgi:glucosamine-6-phosphate deaminase
VLVIVRDEAEEFARDAAALIVDRIRGGRIRTLGVATGSSPLPVYRALADYPLETFSELSLYALDEYVGLARSDPRSYHSVVMHEVATPLGIPATRVHVPDGTIEGLSTAGHRYEAEIASAGGIDLQILGIGTTGHIGFNEPGSALKSRTRIKTLSARTREDNARFFSSLESVPRHCVTQGIGTILDARSLVLVATGKAKSDAITAALEGPLTTMCPGSALQAHPDVTVFLDAAASVRLELLDYHRDAHLHRPDWQLL